MILVARTQYETVVEQLDRLRKQQAEDLLEAASRTADLPRKIALLEEAIGRNPTSWQARVELGRAKHLPITALALLGSLTADEAA
jgi:hypothetical protein